MCRQHTSGDLRDIDKMRGSVIRKIIKVDVKVTSDDELMRCGSSEREKKKLNSSRKAEKEKVSRMWN